VRKFAVLTGLVILIPLASANVGCEEGPATKAELDAIDSIRRVHGHVKTDEGGHALSVALSGPAIRDKDLVPLEQFHDLSFLSLEGAPITDEGLAHLSGLNALKHLSLRGTKITDAGLAHLEGLASLEEVDLEGLPITDAAMPHLAAVKSLRKVYVGPGGPTSAGIDYLKGANPQAHVFQR